MLWQLQGKHLLDKTSEMSTIDKLATSLGRKDDVPNQELAKGIAETNDQSAVAELIADFYQYFLGLLKNKNNRLVWGAMIALKTISNIRPKEIYDNLIEIVDST